MQPPDLMRPSTKRSVWEQAARDADLTLQLPGDVPMFFRRIPAGSFRMGARGAYRDEEPVHRVVIPHEFFLGTFVVTQEQYRAVAMHCPALKENPDPSYFKGPRRPVEHVSWHDATAFCDWLARWKKLPRDIGQVRLPTEAEWEYACRAGAETEFYSGDGAAALAQVGWFEENSGNETHPVDERAESHRWGLHGMHGNVWEWCQDVFDPAAYRKRADGWAAQAWTLADAGDDAHYWTDEDRREQRPARATRGGSWSYSAWFSRSAFRDRFGPKDREGSFGFRVCLAHGSGDGVRAPATDLATTKLPRQPR